MKITCNKTLTYSGGVILTKGNKYKYNKELNSIVDDHGMNIYEFEAYFSKSDIRKFKLNQINDAPKY